MVMDFDALAKAKLAGTGASAIYVLEMVLGATVVAVDAGAHVVTISLAPEAIDATVVEALNRMEIFHKGKTLKMDRVNETAIKTEDGSVKVRQFFFAVPEAKRGPTQAHMEHAKRVFRDMVREAGDRFNPTSVLLDNQPRELEEFIVEAPIGSGRGQGAGFAVVPRYQVK